MRGAACLNVNYGHNQSLMAECRKLREYSILLARIRWELTSGKEFPLAVDFAVQHCIGHQVLDEFLRKYREE